MDVYIDDMVVKSLLAADQIRHLEEAFAVLREYGTKFNPTKYSFGMTSRKFFGYIVTQRGIESSQGKFKSFRH